MDTRLYIVLEFVVYAKLGVDIGVFIENGKKLLALSDNLFVFGFKKA